MTEAVDAPPLSGTRVVDLSRLLPGPWASMLLADYGADVIKVEGPQLPDLMRMSPPFYPEGQSARFQAINRNKRALTLNLKHQAGREALLRLVATADVVLESFRPGVATRLGVDYPACKAVNPGIVYCALTGYGQDGPYRDRPGHDINYLGEGGGLAMTGPAGGAPVVPGIQVADLTGGLLAALGILMALFARERTGQGQLVDVGMLDGIVSLLSMHAGALFAGQPPRRGTMELTGCLPCYRVYQTKDGRYLTVGALEPKFWMRLVTLLDQPGLLPHAFTHPSSDPEPTAILEAHFKTRTRDEWLAFLGNEDVCVGPVLEPEEVFESAQVLHRGMLATICNADGEGERHLGVPIKLSATPGTLRHRAPGLGEHTDDVLAELGYDDGTRAALRAQGVI